MKFLAIARKDIKKIARDKSFLFVLFSQVLVLSVSITFTGAISGIFNLEGAEIPYMNVAVVSDNVSPEIMEKFKTGFKEHYVSFNDAVSLYDRGRYDCVVIFRTKGEGEGERLFVTMIVPDDMRAYIILSGIKNSLEYIEDYTLSVKSGIPKVELEKSGDDKGDSGKPVIVIYGLLLPFIMLSVIVISANLMINILTFEMESKTYDVIISAPLKVSDFLAGKSAVCIAACTAQVILIMLILLYGGFSIAHPVILFVLVTSYALVFISLAVLSSAVAKTRDNSQNIFSLFLFPAFIFFVPVISGALPDTIMELTPLYLITTLSLRQEIPVPAIFLTMVISVIIFLISFRVYERL